MIKLFVFILLTLTIFNCEKVVTTPVPVVSGVTFTSSAESIREGDLFKPLLIFPADANKAVTWSSSSDAIATVSSSGVITGESVGIATITVTITDGMATAKLLVTVTPISVTSVSVDSSTVSLDVRETSRVVVTVFPADATNKAVTWSSSSDAIATVSSSGEITGESVGIATITVTTTDGMATVEVVVTVTIGVSGVSIDSVGGVSIDNSAANMMRHTISLPVGETVRAVTTVFPADATNKAVRWFSFNSFVATVSSSGEITGESVGTTTIRVSTANGRYTAVVDVVVSSVI